MRGGKHGSTLAWDTEAELKRINRLARAGREVDENEAWRPGPEHDVVQAHVGMDDVMHMKHPQGSTYVPKQLWQALLCQELKR